MPLAIPNTTTTDAYKDATFAGNDVFQSGYFTVANNPVSAQLIVGQRGQSIDYPEMFLPPGTYPIRSHPGRPISGIRFKSFTPGTPAQVFGTLFYPSDSLVEAASPFDAQVSPSGAVSGVGGMILIETKDLVAAAPSIAFSNIPQTFRHLCVIASCRGTIASLAVDMFIRLNGDGGANYNRDFVGHPSGGAAATDNQTAGDTSGEVGIIPGSTAVANFYASSVIWLTDYSLTTKLKHARIAHGYMRNAATLWNEGVAFLWQNTAAISSLSLFPNGGNMEALSSASLYGLSG